MAPDDIGIPGLQAQPSGLEAAPEGRPRRRPSEGALLLVWVLLTIAVVVLVLGSGS